MPILRISAFAVFAVAVSACSTPPPAEPPPAPAPVVAAPPPPVQTAHSPDEDWNIFPDPTTGTIDIYHKGEYLGVIDGSEPAEQDPPLPHKSDTQPPPSDQ
ncbi:MAG TPA: hypothetical protein VMH37_16170 [Candidatus Binataceae bacterium]|nr:hypothetical protein [Candidatus Binataceae bacterium]